MVPSYRLQGISAIAIVIGLLSHASHAQEAGPKADQEEASAVMEEVVSRDEPVRTIEVESDDVSQMSSDEIFRKMFGREPPPAAQSRYAVIIDGMNVGEALIDPSDEGWIEGDFLDRKVMPILLADAADALRPLVQQPKVPFAALRALGYRAEFDRRNLVFTLEIPFERRGERVVLLGAQPNMNLVDVIPQSDYSAFISVRSGVDWIQKSANQGNGLSGFVADIDAAVNIKGVVLEGEFRYSENASRKFSRGDVRLVYDDVDSLIRYEAGDLSVGRRPYQNAPNIAGIAAYREFRIDPYLDPRPLGERGLVLERAAQVDVIVNGARSRTVNLPAGRYSLRDFPIIPGAINDVEFVVTYASGETERFVFPAFTNIDLLEEGRTEFAVNVGIPYEDIDFVRDYDTSNFNLIGYVRKGLTSTLTAGASIEADEDLLLVGGEVAWASPVGNFNVNIANDLRNAGIDSGRLSVQYAWRSADPFSGTSVDGLLILTGDEYRTLDQLFEGPAASIYASGRVSHVIDSKTRIQLGGIYQVSSERNEADKQKLWTLSAALTRQFGPVNVTAGLDYTDGDSRADELVGRVSVFIPLGRGTASSSFTTRDNAFRMDYRQAPLQGVGGFGYGAGVQFSDNGDEQYARANYIGNRFEVDLEQRRSHDSSGTDVRTGLAFGTALVMADGDIALSRPVQNGFAIVKNGSDIDAQLAIEPRGSPLGGERRYAAYSDFLGPGVVPDLPPYFVRDIEVDAPDAPAGAGLGGEVFFIKPGYKAGYSLVAGSEGGSVSILGTLFYADGSPASMLSGTVRRIDTEPGDPSKAGDDEPDALFFTNSGGRFFVEGLDPGGRYEVILTTSDTLQRFILTAPEDAIGIFRIDDPITIEGARGDAS